jgi:hypothetical protein
LRRAGSPDRVLPVYYSDNYVFLLPDESKTITIEAALSDLKGGKPLVVVDGWNIGVTPASSPDAEVALNEDAQVAHWPVTGLPIYYGPPMAEVHVNCGGPATNGFDADTGGSGGNVFSVADTIDTSAPGAGPAAIYQTERWGACSYRFSMKPLPPGRSYTVRLHFAETKYVAAGQRAFNVEINGRKVLANFDIFQEAGGKDKALVREFTGLQPDDGGNFVIQFRKSYAEEPKICAIEIVSAAGGAQSAGATGSTMADLTNLAAHRSVTVSSVSDDHQGANAVDGSLDTRWSSAYTDHEWICVDLGAVKDLTGAELNWEAAYAQAYKLQVSDDGQNWANVYSTADGKGDVERFHFTAHGRYVRMLGLKRATTYGYSLWEFEVYGK